MMEILVTASYIVVCVLLFSLAIAIHEFGHFIVALKLGLRVERFSIGFGPAIWKKTYRGVEYRLSWIPLGGYVSIPDVDPEGTKALEGETGAKSQEEKIPAWKEILVAAAGPAMNLVLAVVLAILLALVPGAHFGELPAVVGQVMDDGPAAQGGLQAGDRVLAVGGHPVATWTEMVTEVQLTDGRATPFRVARAGEEVTLSITPSQDEASGVYYILALSETNGAARCAMWMPARNPLKQLAFDAKQIFRVLKGLVTPREMKATGKALGGPVLIAEQIYASVRRDVWDGLGFLRFLNVNLAVLNLLPIPVLDGGLILFALIALVFRRRVPEKCVAAVSTAFMYLLLGLMAIIIYRDVVRSWNRHAREVPAARETAPAPSESETNHATENSDENR